MTRQVGDPVLEGLDIEHPTVFKGAGSGLAFGGIKVEDNTTETAIAEADVPVQVTVFDTDGISNNTTPDHTNDHITIDKDGCYLVLLSASINSVAGAGSELNISCKKNNGSSNVIPAMDREITGGGGSPGVISMSDGAVLSVGDTIEAWIKNKTNVQNYVVTNISLFLLLLGGV